MRKTGSAVSVVLAASVSLFALGGAHAETLADALEAAYRTNPDLQGARADLRSVDETYVQARSGWQPQLEAGATGQYNKGQAFDFFGNKVTNETNNGAVNIALSQPLYTGGLVGAQVNQTLADIQTQRQTLRGTEANILFQVISAYMNVVTDQQALIISQDALAAYRREVDEINARLRAGELTRTDVAQVEAQFQSQQGVVNNAAAQLQTSRAAYFAVVGVNPGQLEAPGALPGLPTTVDAAFDEAEKNSPSLAAAVSRSDAARYRIDEARAAFQPKITATVRYGYNGALLPANRDDFTNSLIGQVTVTQPLFTGGLNNSRLRQAKANADSSTNAVEASYRGMIQNVGNAWNAMIAAQRNVVTGQAAVNAAQAAFTGMQVEYRADQRSTYELLNAESNLHSAQLSLLGSQRDQYLAAGRLLGVMGHLEASQILPGIEAYDPTANFNKVRYSGSIPTSFIPQTLDSFSGAAGPSNYTPPKSAPSTPPMLRPAQSAPAADAPMATAFPTDRKTTQGR